MTLLDRAREYIAAGISVIPVGARTKKPALAWGVYQKRLPTDAEIARWFDGSRGYRLGIVTGEVSGNLEVMDFDCVESFHAFYNQVNTLPDLGAVAGRCPVVRTPSGGFHVYYRLESPPLGNTVYAKTEEAHTRIESRGEGGYVLAPPTDDYKEEHLTVLDVPVITEEERLLLTQAACSFNGFVEEHDLLHGPQGKAYEGQLRPGDDYGARGDFPALLEKHGWKNIGERAEVTLWQRPGKDGEGPSATTGLGGKPIFYVFSSNAHPFQALKAYSYFSAYAILEHAGEFTAAASALVAQGYGTPPGEYKSAGVEVSIGTGFDRILPISSHVLPTFPLSVFPPWIRDFVAAVAESTQTPADLGAMLCLSTVAAACAKTVEVFPREDWSEQVNLYTVCALPPGSRKSSVFSLVAKPLMEYERRYNENTKLEVALAEDQRAVLEGKLKRLRDAAHKTREDEKDVLFEEFRETRVALADLNSTAPRSIRLVADDVTPEKLASLLAEYGGKMAILSADTDIFAMMSGKYSGGMPNLEVYLKGHAGDDLTVDRVGREKDVIHKPALTLGLAVQPDVLHGLMKKQGFRGRGIIGRWMYSLPEDKIGFRSFKTPPVPMWLIEQYKSRIIQLAELAPDKDDFGVEKPYVLRYTPEAEEQYWEWAETIEYRQRPGGDLEDMKDWASKLHGLVARLSALLHMAWGLEDREPWLEPIPPEVLERALNIAMYAIYHAKAAFHEMGADEIMNKARRILEWIRRSERGEFSRRDVQMYLPSLFVKAEDLEAPLKLLQDRGYIRPLAPPEQKGAGRRYSARFESNPKLWTDESDQNVVQVPFHELIKSR